MIPKSLDTLRIDINSGKVRKAVSICQQDTVQRTLNFLLVNSGNSVDLSNVLFAEILIHKADGAEADNGCVIDGDSIQYTLRTTDVSALGTNQAQLLLTFEDGQTLTTPTFEINVYSKVLDQNVQKSQNEYGALTEQLVLVNEMSNQIGAARDTAVAKATEAEASATAAAESATSANAAKDDVAASATAAATSAGEAAASATLAVNAAGEADTYADNAADSAFEAAQSKDDAASSATAAAASASSASTSAYTATQKAAEIVGDADAAAASAASANAAKENVAANASAAAASASAAATSATNAANSESNASTYANNAADSAAEALQSKNAAAASATAAGTSASSASTSSYTATEKATEAAASASAAGDSADAAATSASNAAISEDNALDYAERAEEAYRKMGEEGLVLGETDSTAYRGDRGKIAYDHSQTTGNPHNTTAAQVGADVAGAAAQAYQQAAGYTDTKIADLVNGAPSTLDTLKEIADAMAEHEDVVEALEQAIGTKASDVEFQAHQNNTTVHVTANERTAWNGKANLSGGNTFTNGNQTIQGNNINVQSTNITRGTARSDSGAWGDSRINILDANGDRVAFIQPYQQACGITDLRIQTDNNNVGGRILINGVDIEQINSNLTCTYDSTTNKFYQLNSDGTRGAEISMGMEVLKYGVITSTQTINLGETIDPSNYMVNLNTNAKTGYVGYNTGAIGTVWGYGYGCGAYVSAKTSTSVTISVSSGLSCSYEIIKLR